MGRLSILRFDFSTLSSSSSALYCRFRSQSTRIRRSGRPRRSHAYVRIIRRTLLLFALGMVYNHFLDLNIKEFRWPGVLQRIAICYFFAAMVVLHLGVAGQAIVLAGISAGYWAALKYIPAPGFSAFDLTMEGNLVGYVDRLLLPGKYCCYKLGDNEGVLSTIPAIGTTLLKPHLRDIGLKSERSSGAKIRRAIRGRRGCPPGGRIFLGPDVSNQQDPLDQLVRPLGRRAEPLPVGLVLFGQPDCAPAGIAGHSSSSSSE